MRYSIGTDSSVLVRDANSADAAAEPRLGSASPPSRTASLEAITTF